MGLETNAQTDRIVSVLNSSLTTTVNDGVKMVLTGETLDQILL